MVTVAKFSNSYFRDVNIAGYDPFTINPAVEVINCTEPDQVASEVKKLQKTWLSWDMEWRYDRNTGATGKVALIQLGDPKRILLIRTVGMSELPQELVDILENPDIPKIGVNIRGDGKKVHDDFGIHPQSLLELSRVAHKLDKEFWPMDRTFGYPISLQHLVARYLQRYLSKEVRISDWELELSEEQQLYAACDVDAYNQIFTRFISLAANNPEPIDFLSDPDCRVNYDDPDPFESRRAAPLKAAQSAPAVLAGSTSSLPISLPRPQATRVVIMPPQRSITLATLAPAPAPAPPSNGERELDASPSPGQTAPQNELDEDALSDDDAEDIDFDDDDDFELSEEMERQLDDLEEQHARAKRAASEDSDATSRLQESPPKKPKVA